MELLPSPQLEQGGDMLPGAIRCPFSASSIWVCVQPLSQWVAVSLASGACLALGSSSTLACAQVSWSPGGSRGMCGQSPAPQPEEEGQ